MISEQLKASIATRAQQIFIENYIGSVPSMACIFWAKAGVLAAREAGFPNAQIQAGTANWRRLPYDDETECFGYAWEGMQSGRVISCLAQAKLPEIHAWVGFPDEQLLLDLTAGFQPANALSALGYGWERPMPEYIFCTAEESRASCWFYEADLSATVLCWKFLTMSCWGGYHLVPGENMFEVLMAAGSGEPDAMRMEPKFPLHYSPKSNRYEHGSVKVQGGLI